MLFVLCVVLWLPAEVMFSCFVLFGFLLLCLVDHVQICIHLLWKGGDGCFDIRCFVLSWRVCSSSSCHL